MTPRERSWLWGFLVMLGITASLMGSGLTLAQPRAAGGVPDDSTRFPHRIFDRVFIIVLENTKYGTALQRPYLRHLTTIGALLTDYHAVAHPSYPNYLALVAGSTFRVRHDEPGDLDATSLVDLLEAGGVSWKVYVEDLPGPCFTGLESRDGLYVRKHEPYISFRTVHATPARCERIVDAGQLRADLAKDALPAYSLYVPNLRNDGHDPPLLEPRAWVQILMGRDPGLAADAWLRGFLSPLLEDPRFTRGTLVVVTFDENNGARGNQVYTALVGPMVQPGATNGNRYDHYSLLRTIEDNFGVGTLGREDATATPFCCVWKE